MLQLKKIFREMGFNMIEKNIFYKNNLIRANRKYPKRENTDNYI